MKPLKRNSYTAKNVKITFGGLDSKGVPEGYIGRKPLADTGLPKVPSLTGALRQKNPVEKGRFDLIPPDVMDRVLASFATTLDEAETDLYAYLAGKRGVDALAQFAASLIQAMGGRAPALRRLAVHYARGCEKYGEDRNWQKGQETGRTVDSMLRHYYEFQCGKDDEDHAAASLWNVVALMWAEERIALPEGGLPRSLDTYGLVPE